MKTQTASPAMTLTLRRPIASRTVSTAFVARCAGDTVLIDTGEPGHRGVLLSAIDAISRDPQNPAATPRLAAILITHCHPDHTGSLAAMAQATGAAVYASALDSALIETGVGGRGTTPKPDLFSRFMHKRIVTGGTQTVEPCRVTYTIAQGAEIALAGGIEVVPLPGHTIGHIGFLFRATGDFFVGDALMNLLGPRRSRWHEDAAAETASLHVIAQLPWQRLHVAHGRTVSRAAFLRMMRREPKT